MRRSRSWATVAFPARLARPTDRKSVAPQRLFAAITGKTYCRADKLVLIAATYGPRIASRPRAAVA